MDKEKIDEIDKKIDEAVDSLIELFRQIQNDKRYQRAIEVIDEQK